MKNSVVKKICVDWAFFGFKSESEHKYYAKIKEHENYGTDLLDIQSNIPWARFLIVKKISV